MQFYLLTMLSAVNDEYKIIIPVGIKSHLVVIMDLKVTAVEKVIYQLPYIFSKTGQSTPM